MVLAEEFLIACASALFKVVIWMPKTEAGGPSSSEAPGKIPTKLDKKIADYKDDFNKILFYSFSKYEQFFRKIKGYFVFRMENLENAKTKMIILYDDDFKKHPEVNSFETEDEKYDIKKYQLNDFIDILCMENAKEQ